MNLPRHRFSSSSSIAAALLAAVALAVTGCSLDATQGVASSGSADLTGVIHGGPNPVVGATVTLYATQSNGYGGAGLQLAQTTTSSNGGFSFNSSSYTCPAGQQAYITAAAGNTGGNTTNVNSLLMAAIGPCSGLSASTYVWIDEPSTIAAAYALSNFIKITGTGASTVVGISAPANNNVATGSCTGTGTSMTCVAAGLAHAFLNAANLVNASNSNGITTATPTGQVYASPPSNQTTGSTAVALQNVVPQQLINSLANSVQACVNSSGVTGTGDTTSACGQLFTAATVSSTYTSNATYTSKPANTLQALINLAKFPFTSVSGVYGVASGSSPYQPTLTSAPPDWSIAIIWRSYGSGANEIGTVYYTTTDINDNVYATALTAPATGSILGGAPYIAHSLSSDGAGNWAGPATILSTLPTTYTCDSNGATAATSGACFAATDTAGNLWVGMGSNNFTGGGLWQVKTSGGAVTQFTTAVSSTTYYPFAFAVDALNDVFYSGTLNGSDNLFKMPAGATSSTAPTVVTTGGAAYAGAHLSDSLVFDTQGNLFAPLASGSNFGFMFAQNYTATPTLPGTVALENFNATANQCNCVGETNVGDGKWPTGGMVDANGAYWWTGLTGVAKVGSAANTPTGAATNAQAVTGGGSTGVNSFTIGTSAATLRISSMDGVGTIFVPDNDTNGTVNQQSGPPTAPSPALQIYYTVLGTNPSIQGCNVGTATGNTACITGNQTAPNSGLFYQAVNPAIDSTGSLWVSSEGNDAVIQVIGLAAPTWPQTSYLHPGVMPQ